MSLRQPKRYPVKFYSWQDTGAPQLSNNDGVIKTILKACLVTGYGNKEGAAWQMPFEDDYRMVLKMPMRTGNPPDIRLENGIVNNVGSHRICGIAAATGLDDTPLTSTPILTKDAHVGQEWFVVASDFAFWFYARLGENGYADKTRKHHVMYVGAVSPMKNELPNYIISSAGNIDALSGRGGAWLYGMNSTSININMLNNLITNVKTSLSLATLAVDELESGGYVGQPAFMMTGDRLPIYASLSERFDQADTLGQISLGGRPMLRTPQRYYQSSLHYGARNYYVPLDYWEL